MLDWFHSRSYHLFMQTQFVEDFQRKDQTVEES